jgi:hypothetical protein
MKSEAGMKELSKYFPRLPGAIPNLKSANGIRLALLSFYIKLRLWTWHRGLTPQVRFLIDLRDRDIERSLAEVGPDRQWRFLYDVSIRIFDRFPAENFSELFTSLKTCEILKARLPPEPLNSAKMSSAAADEIFGLSLFSCELNPPHKLGH